MVIKIITANFYVSQGSVIDITTRLLAGQSGVRTPAGARDFYLL
jgi:hypothetical protein